ncbi:UNVERIFIED_CONTAM: hypothetical protein HDU68_012594 [Siphonaria sp. JEL0065]|nr:hypothetical protein HDU68_012594 [Siphonaria sp. JEL0065]
MTKIETTETIESRFSGVEIISRGKGSTETTILTAPTTQSSSFFASVLPTEVKYTHDLDAKTIVTCTTVNDKLQVHVDYAEENRLIPGLLVNWWFTGSKEKEQKTVLEITLPPSTDLQDFSIDGAVGTLEYNGPKTKNTFLAKLNVGVVNLKSVETEDLEVVTNVGSIQLGESTIVRNKATLSTNVGEVRGTVRGFKELAAIADMGEVRLDLYPAKDASIQLSSGMGAVFSNVFGFQGKFDVKTGFGSYEVSGNGFNGVGKSSGMGTMSGWVSDKSAFGNLKADAGMGGITLKFL